MKLQATQYERKYLQTRCLIGTCIQNVFFNSYNLIIKREIIQIITDKGFEQILYQRRYTSG